MKKFILLGILFSAIFCFPSSSISEEQENFQELKATYRSLIRAIYQKNFGYILNIVHENAVKDADSIISKAEFASELKDPNGYIQEGLYAPLLPFQKEICTKAGKAAISPYEFYKLYSENYEIKVTVLSEDEIFSVGAEGRKASDGDKNCRYYLFPKMFKKEKDGKFYLIQNF
jgi:hypothetical protein